MKNNINFFDLKKQYDNNKDEIDNAINRVLQSSDFSGGSFTKKFENNFALYCNTDYVCCVNSGTSALHLALLALDIKPRDEVIVPTNTFIATAWAPLYANAIPVFVDCDPETWNLDINDLERKITKRTKAVIGVHLYGQPFEVDSVREICKQNGLLLVEDCAQAHGAKYKGKKVGGISDIGCFSFYPSKNLGAFGEGGAIATNSIEYCEKIRKLRNHGSVEKYYHEVVGFNMRMDSLQGAVLDVKLKYLDTWNKRRREVAEKYITQIHNKKIKFQRRLKHTVPVYHLFVVTVEEREKFISMLEDENIHCGLHYPIPCHLQKAFSNLGYKSGDFPNSEFLSNHCVSLPIYPELSNDKVDKIIDLINKY